jgi:Transcriptional regulatory protein, C terminal
MTSRYFFIIVLVFAGMVAPCQKVRGQDYVTERHIIVALRMVGHQMLLRSGDSVSLVLPVEKKEDRYKLTFQTPFQFSPDDLVGLIDSVVRQTSIANRYLVEVESCEFKKVVYSYEMGISAKSELVPCTGRVQPKACYTVFITILEPGIQVLPLQSSETKLAGSFSETPGNFNYFTLVLPIAGLILITILFFRKKKNSVLPTENPDLISIGAYQFDKRNMTLTVNRETVELTGKEADLLFLMHNSANITIEREVILNAVWGDEGDYAGRTLDVFISKLRKKLEADESLKIVNIRGVGYKLIVNA